MAIGVLLLQLLITTETFYWSMSELPYCLSLLFPLVALLETPVRRPPLRYATITLLIVTIAFGHSLAMFGLGFTLLLLWLRTPQTRPQVWITAGIYGVALVVKTIFFRDPYDRGALGGLRNFVRLFPDYFSAPSLHLFLQRCLTDFIWLPLLLTALLTWYVLRRLRLQALLIVGTFAGYLLLVIVCFPQADATRFYSENIYQPLAFFLLLPFCLDWLNNPQMRFSGAGIAVLIVVTAAFRIPAARQRYVTRLDWERGLIGAYAGQKVIIPEASLPEERYLLSWSSPYEFWLLSTLEGESAASINITKDPAEAQSRIGTATKTFLPAFGVYDYSRLPRRYFPFRDTASSYRITD
jgi:hypothetical protein